MSFLVARLRATSRNLPTSSTLRPSQKNPSSLDILKFPSSLRGFSRGQGISLKCHFHEMPWRTAYRLFEAWHLLYKPSPLDVPQHIVKGSPLVQHTIPHKAQKKWETILPNPISHYTQIYTPPRRPEQWVMQKNFLPQPKNTTKYRNFKHYTKQNMCGQPPEFNLIHNI
jgi:hypothetical protein